MNSALKEMALKPPAVNALEMFTPGEVCNLIVDITNEKFQIEIRDDHRTSQYQMARRIALELMQEFTSGMALYELAAFVKRDRSTANYVLANAPINRQIKARIRAHLLITINPIPFIKLANSL